MTERRVFTPSAERFQIDYGSAEMIGKVIDVHTALKSEYPYLQGVGFFGSRLQGRAKPDSDLDTCIFVDGNEMSRDRGFNDHVAEIRDRFHTETGVNLGNHIGAVMNISLEKTDMDIYDYFRLAESVRFRPKREKIETVIQSHEAQNLFSRFFLSIGEGVQKNRKYILEQFDGWAREKEYFSLLMQALAYFEQYRVIQDLDELSIENYPSSIEEAKAQFLISPPSSL